LKNALLGGHFLKCGLKTAFSWMVEAVQRSIQWKDMEGSGMPKTCSLHPGITFRCEPSGLEHFPRVSILWGGIESLHSHCSLPRQEMAKGQRKHNFLPLISSIPCHGKSGFDCSKGVGAAYVRFLTYSVSLRQVISSPEALCQEKQSDLPTAR
jgi:hypothetical protein